MKSSRGAAQLLGHPRNTKGSEIAHFFAALLTLTVVGRHGWRAISTPVYRYVQPAHTTSGSSIASVIYSTAYCVHLTLPPYPIQHKLTLTDSTD